jgi:hypothetical protein
MCVAGSKFGPGIADADHRPPIEKVFGKPLVLHPASVDKAHLIRFPKPIPASALGHTVDKLK